MRFEVANGPSREIVGPPGGPTVTVPGSAVITVTANPPHDLRLTLAWNERERRLTLREATFVATADDEPVRMASIIRVAIGELIAQAMEAEVLGERGWAGVVADHPDDDHVHVDALVYLLSVAIGSPKPSANVAIARGLSPASGPKRVGSARKAGLLPETESGRPSAGLSTFQTTAKSMRR